MVLVGVRVEVAAGAAQVRVATAIMKMMMAMQAAIASPLLKTMQVITKNEFGTQLSPP